MLDSFHKYNTEKALFHKDDKLLVTVSGGVDSVVLVHLLKKYGAKFAIAHCNFGLRGEESDQDEAFVEALGEEMEVSIHVKKFDTYAYVKNNGMSTQMAARALRYAWFAELSEQKDYRWILTAHQQNDLTETVLLNLVRGTGIAGLHGIQPKQGNIIRPLLFASKESILAYATGNKLTWREDSSNQSTHYQRNLIRLEVIPLLKKLNPNLENTLQQSVEKIAAAETIFNHYIEGCKAEFLKQDTSFHSLDYRFLEEEAEPLIILFELLRPYGFSYIQCAEIIQAFPKEAGKKFISPSHLLVKDRNQLIITKTENTEMVTEIEIQKEDSQVIIPWDNKVVFLKETSGFKKTEDKNFIFLNYKKLQFPLIIRPWKNGDTFEPFGMRGSKKVSDFLNELKIPLNLKPNISVLISGEDIVWVMGHRISESYKAEEGQQSLAIKITS